LIRMGQDQCRHCEPDCGLASGRDASEDGMSGEYSFTDLQDHVYLVLLHDTGRAAIRCQRRNDCRDAGGPDILDVLYFCGRWTVAEYSVRTVVLLALASMKKGRAVVEDRAAGEADVKDWLVQAVKGQAAMAAGVLAPSSLDAVIPLLRGTSSLESLVPLFRGAKVGPFRSLTEGDYGRDAPAFGRDLPYFEVEGRYSQGTGEDAAHWCLHPDGGLRRQSRSQDMLGTWERLHTNIVEVTFVRVKDLLDDEVYEHVNQFGIFVDEGQLRDPSTSSTFFRDLDFVGPWPSTTEFSEPRATPIPEFQTGALPQNVVVTVPQHVVVTVLRG